MMDFVFSEREDGGVFDNRNGMDYHVPVFGGIAKEPPLHIVHIAVEMAPIAKVQFSLGYCCSSRTHVLLLMLWYLCVIFVECYCLCSNKFSNFQSATSLQPW